MAAPLPLRKVFHKIITSGHQRLQPLFDCLLTIVVNGKGPRARLPRAHHQVALGHRLTGRLLPGSNPSGLIRAVTYVRLNFLVATLNKTNTKMKQVTVIL